MGLKRTDEFRQDAVRIALTSGLTRKQVADGGMEVSDAKKLKALEAENAKLKKLLAEQMMDVSTLKEMLGKNF